MSRTGEQRHCSHCGKPIEDGAEFLRVHDPIAESLSIVIDEDGADFHPDCVWPILDRLGEYAYATKGDPDE